MGPSGHVRLPWVALNPRQIQQTDSQGADKCNFLVGVEEEVIVLTGQKTHWDWCFKKLRSINDHTRWIFELKLKELWVCSTNQLDGNRYVSVAATYNNLYYKLICQLFAQLTDLLFSLWKVKINAKQNGWGLQIACFVKPAVQHQRCY